MISDKELNKLKADAAVAGRLKPLVMWRCPGCGYEISDAVMQHGDDDYPCSCGYFTFGDFNEIERPRKTYPKVPEVGKCETIDGVRHVEILR